jgi:hypothetical protein
MSQLSVSHGKKGLEKNTQVVVGKAQSSRKDYSFILPPFSKKALFSLQQSILSFYLYKSCPAGKHYNQTLF